MYRTISRLWRIAFSLHHQKLKIEMNKLTVRITLDEVWWHGNDNQKQEQVFLRSWHRDWRNHRIFADDINYVGFRRKRRLKCRLCCLEDEVSIQCLLTINCFVKLICHRLERHDGVCWRSRTLFISWDKLPMIERNLWANSLSRRRSSFVNFDAEFLQRMTWLTNILKEIS